MLIRPLLRIIFCMIVSSGASAAAPNWGYGPTDGPATWPENFPLCKTGKEQTPINIQTKHIKSNPKLPELTTHIKDTDASITNTGKTLQITMKGNNTISLGEKNYRILQFHFHHPSETTINGRHFPLEAHIVTQSAQGDFAVIGIMFKRGKANSLITQLWNANPAKQGQNTKLNTKINIGNLLPNNLSYYHFKGSLTTPPCTEGFNWYVLKKPMAVSKKQIKTFTSLYPKNNRPVQPLNRRVVEAN